MQRLGVAAGHVVVHGLLDVVERDLPGVVVVGARLELLDRVELAAVHAVMELDLLRADALVDVHREDDLLAGHDLGIARLDVLQPGVGRPDDVGQEGPPGGVEDALGGEGRVEA